MKRKVNFFLLLFLLVFTPYKVKALCDDTEYIRLSKLASNVKIIYTYNNENNDFTITLTNLKKDLKIEYLNELKVYNTDKEININQSYSGKHTFMIYSKNDKCENEYLITKNVYLPFRNSYADDKICEGIENYIYCQKWSNRNDGKEFYYNKIIKYKEEQKEKQNIEVTKNNKNKILEFIEKIYVEYYYILLPSVIFILCLIIYIKNKKESLV